MPYGLRQGSGKLRFWMLEYLKKRTRLLAADQVGGILSTELVLLATTVLVGGLIGLVSTRDAVVSELSDAAGAVQDFKQAFSFNGLTGHSASTCGTEFADAMDFCDAADDASGAADNCITFAAPPSNESDAEAATFVLSDVGIFDFDDVTTGVGGSASGTIGDGTIDTGFTVTTDTGNIAGTTGGNEIRFRENDANSGTFTIAFDEPLTEVEFWIRNLANIVGSIENLIGNFMLTLSDGSIINNAAFSILPDIIAPNQDYGLFSTRNNDTSPLTTVTRGGAQFLTDPAFDGTANQASGRIVFTDLPSVSNPPGPNPVGLSSIKFDRSGGPNGFQANFSTSGRVIREE